MPYFHMTTNVALNPTTCEKLKNAFGQIVSDIPGKSETWLMVGFTAESGALYFAGSDAPCAMVEISSYGRIPTAAFDPLTRDVTEAIVKNTAIPADRIYVKYAEVAHWGLGGENF